MEWADLNKTIFTDFLRLYLLNMYLLFTSSSYNACVGTDSENSKGGGGWIK